MWNLSDFQCDFQSDDRAWKTFGTKCSWRITNAHLMNFRKITHFTVKGNEAQVNNFCLKSSFLSWNKIVTKKLRKFSCMPQLIYYLCSSAVKASLTLRRVLIIQSFKLRNFVKNDSKRLTLSWQRIRVQNRYSIYNL